MLAALASELLPAATRGVLASQAATCSSIVGSSSSSTWSRALSGLSASTSSSAPAPAGAAAAEQQLEAHARALGLVGGIGGSGGVSGLPFALPEHEIEDGLPSVRARVRAGEGSNFCAKLRRGGRTPAQVFSLPGERRLLIDLDSKDAAALVRSYGRNGLLARVLKVEVEDPEGRPLGAVRVLPKAVHMNSVTLAVENLRLLFLPRTRRARVPVPVTPWGAEAAPGVRAGGWLHMVKRAAPLACEGWAVPPRIELDVRHMKPHDIIRFRDLPLPKGCALRVRDATQPVARCAMQVGGE